MFRTCGKEPSQARADNRTQYRPHGRASPLAQFARQLRADSRLNATARLAWLLTDLSRRQPASMSRANLARELGGISQNTLDRALQQVVYALALFERQDGVKGHRAARYSRSRVGGTQADFPRQVRMCKKLNLAVRVAWLLVDVASRFGYADLSLTEMAQQLSARPQNVWAAIQRLVALGLFRVAGGGGRGHRNRYYPVAVFVVPKTDQADDQQDDGILRREGESTYEFFARNMTWQTRNLKRK